MAWDDRSEHPFVVLPAAVSLRATSRWGSGLTGGNLYLDAAKFGSGRWGGWIEVKHQRLAQISE